MCLLDAPRWMSHAARFPRRRVSTARGHTAGIATEAMGVAAPVANTVAEVAVVAVVASAVGAVVVVAEAAIATTAGTAGTAAAGGTLEATVAAGGTLGGTEGIETLAVNGGIAGSTARGAAAVVAALTATGAAGAVTAGTLPTVATVARGARARGTLVATPPRATYSDRTAGSELLMNKTECSRCSTRDVEVAELNETH